MWKQNRIRMGTVTLLFSMLFVLGCSGPAHRILSANNAYYYYNDVYGDLNCKNNPIEPCLIKKEALLNFDKQLTRATDAMRRGGSYPLQLKAVKEAEKKTKGLFKK